jgi:hypothetical protein
VVAVNGLVVAVPLVGSVPLHPPDAVQDCASFALHCKIVEVPMATLVFVAASVMVGFTPSKPTSVVWLLAELPHADIAENAAQASTHCKRREALAKRNVRLSPTNWMAHPALKTIPDHRLGLRPTKLIILLPHADDDCRASRCGESS